MPDTPPPDLPDVHAPPRPEGGLATRVASSVSSEGYGVDPDDPGVPYAGLRLAALLGALVWLGFANLWMLIVVLAVVVMIFLHELGHYVTAKRAGMKVTEFFLGFGPKIWSFRKGETEYGIKLIPAGAYVKIPGMVNLDDVDPEDEARTYRQKSFGQRLSVAVAGSAMHFVLAMVLIYTALVVIGQPGGSIVGGPSARLPVIEQVIPGSGAERGGLKPGDQILSVDGIETPTSQELIATVGPLRGTTVPVSYDRDGEVATTSVSLQQYTYRGQSSCGLGISMEPPQNEQVSPAAGLVAAPREFAEIMWLSVRGLAAFFSPSGISDFASQVGSAQEDRAAPADDADGSDQDPCTPTAPGAAAPGGGGETGENRILSIYGLVRLGSDVGGVDPGALIGLFALINIFIGVFNLMPLLPFDGGHVAIAVYERIQERRLRRRRYFTDVSRLLPLTYGVVAVLAMLFFSSLYLDVVNPIGG